MAEVSATARTAPKLTHKLSTQSGRTDARGRTGDGPPPRFDLNCGT